MRSKDVYESLGDKAYYTNQKAKRSYKPKMKTIWDNQPWPLRGSYSNQQLLDLGFVKFDGGWKVPQSKFDELSEMTLRVLKTGKNKIPKVGEKKTIDEGDLIPVDFPQYGEKEQVETPKGNIYTWSEVEKDHSLFGRSLFGRFTYEGGEFTMYYDPQMGQFDNREPIEGDPKAQQVIDSLPDEYFASDRYGNEKETVISGIIDMILDGGTEEQLEEGKKFPRTSEFLYKKVDAIEEIKQLAGVYQPVEEGDGSMGSNISKTANQISSIMKEKNIQPGTPEWFQLWFSKPYLTGEKPYGE